MDVVIGITGKGYTMMLTDCSAIRSIFALKHDEDKVTVLDKSKVLACAGEQSSRVQFSEFIAKNMALHRMRTNLDMSNHAAANYIRHKIAESLRSRSAYQANVLYGGVDDEGAALYYLDYLGSLQKVPFTAHGYSAYFVLSTLDRNWKEDMTIEEGEAVMKQLLTVLNTRFIINMPNFTLTTVTADGVSQKPFSLDA